MSRVRWAVRYGDNRVGCIRYSTSSLAVDEARGESVVRVRCYSPAETAARRAVIEAARAWHDPAHYDDSAHYESLLDDAVAALEALERKAVEK